MKNNFFCFVRFELYYYTAEGSCLTMSVDTRYKKFNKEEENNDREKTENFLSIPLSSIEKLIHTKYFKKRLKKKNLNLKFRKKTYNYVSIFIFFFFRWEDAAIVFKGITSLT